MQVFLRGLFRFMAICYACTACVVVFFCGVGGTELRFFLLRTKDASFPLVALLYLFAENLTHGRMVEMAVQCLFPFCSFGMALDICVCFWDELFCVCLWATACVYFSHYYCMKIAGIYISPVLHFYMAINHE
jgi:hypothetical protein